MDGRAGLGNDGPGGRRLGCSAPPFVVSSRVRLPFRSPSDRRFRFSFVLRSRIEPAPPFRNARIRAFHSPVVSSLPGQLPDRVLDPGDLIIAQTIDETGPEQSCRRVPEAFRLGAHER